MHTCIEWKAMGTYYALSNALAEDGRIGEVEELWMKIFFRKFGELAMDFLYQNDFNLLQ